MTATLKSRRIKGGAIVTVTRGDRVRQYHVSLLRHTRLRYLLICWPRSAGSTRIDGTFQLYLPSPEAGYAEALRNARRYGGRKVRALFPSSSPPRPRRAAVHSPAAPLPGLSEPLLP